MIDFIVGVRRWWGRAVLVIEVVRLLFVVEVALRTAALPEVCKKLGVSFDHLAPVSGADSIPPMAWWEVDATVRRVRRVTRFWPFGDTCLRQALVCAVLLRDLRPTLVLGVRRRDEEIQAHAWLMVAGRNIDPEAATYASFRVD